MNRLPALDELTDVARRVEADDNVAAVLLAGSYAHGMNTAACDVDLLVVVDREDERWRSGRTGRLDLQVLDRRRFRSVPKDPSRWWDRYRMARSQVLLDRSDGAVEQELQAWGRLTETEQQDAVDFYLDPYLSYSARSLLAAEAGEEREAHLDAMEALPWALRLIFAVHNRVRPTNRFLAWELRQHPLPAPWDVDEVLTVVDTLRQSAAPTMQRRLFGHLEPDLRRIGFGGVLAGHGPAVAALRG